MKITVIQKHEIRKAKRRAKRLDKELKTTFTCQVTQQLTYENKRRVTRNLEND